MSWNAHVWVKCSNEFKWENDNWEWLKDWDVKRAWSTMGDWDFCVEVAVNNPEELEKFVWSKVKKHPWIADTHSTWSKEVWAS